MVLRFGRILWLLAVAALLELSVASFHPALGQYIGNVSLQTVQQRVFTNQSSPAFFDVNNVGQNVHFVVYRTSAATTSVRIRIEASTDGVTFFPISTEATDLNSGAVMATGYFPLIRVSLLAIEGVVTEAFYTGTFVSGDPPRGIFNQAQNFRSVLQEFQCASGGSTVERIENLNFANTLGWLIADLRTTAGITSFSVSASALGPAGEDFFIFQNLSLTPNQINIVPVPAVWATQVKFTIQCNSNPPFSVPTVAYYQAQPTAILHQASGEIPQGIPPGNPTAKRFYEAGFVCDRQVAFSAGLGTTQIIASSAGQSVRICNAAFSTAGAGGATVRIVQGTGANCATGTVDITQVLNLPQGNTVVLPFGSSGALRGGISQAVCLAVDTNTVTGVITYAQF